MLKLRTFDKKDIENIDLDFVIEKQHKDAFIAPEHVHGYTLTDDGVILGMGGIHKMWGRVAEGWFFISKQGKIKYKSVVKHTYYMFDVIETENELDRIQASVSADDPTAIRFAKWLGFENEGLMRQYGVDGGDYYRMARIK